MNNIKSEDVVEYRVTPDGDDSVIAKAMEILRRRMDKQKDLLASPQMVRDWLSLRIASLEYEVFGCIWLDSQNRLLCADEMFRGTLTQTSVYPREVVKEALRHNAAAVLLYHNHPSGRAEPSGADEALTKNLKNALALVDVRVLDHFIVAGSTVTSFAERGLI